MPCLCAHSINASACPPETPMSMALPVACAPGFSLRASMGCWGERYPELTGNGKPSSSRILSMMSINSTSIPSSPVAWHFSSSRLKYFRSSRLISFFRPSQSPPSGCLVSQLRPRKISNRTIREHAPSGVASRLRRILASKAGNYLRRVQARHIELPRLSTSTAFL